MGMGKGSNMYDPRWQAIEEVHFDWRCIVCCIVTLSPHHLEDQHLPGRVFTLTLTTPPGSSVTNVTPLSTCNVQPGSLKVWSEIKDFCAYSSFADNFKCVGVHLDLCILDLTFYWPFSTNTPSQSEIFYIHFYIDKQPTITK